MPLNTAKLQVDYLQLMTDMRQKDTVSDTEFSQRFATMMEAFVKTGDVQAGITVSTTGTAAAQTGATTGTGKII